MPLKIFHNVREYSQMRLLTSNIINLVSFLGAVHILHVVKFSSWSCLQNVVASEKGFSSTSFVRLPDMGSYDRMAVFWKVCTFSVKIIF